MNTGEADISGKTIHGFRIIQPIGQGKFSIVYKAEREEDGFPVALKKIKIFDMMDPKQREKCLKEVRLLESLNHAHIVRYLDSFIADNELLIAIEWAERGDLKKVIKRAQSEESSIEEAVIWDYMEEIASALNHMHEKRIMHRDLKPANIFIARNGALKLGDLGLGRYFATETIEAFSRVGTPLYMSPEVLKGQGYDWKSDVWSLGCVVYELAGLRSPFKTDDMKMSLYDLFHAINKGEYPPLPVRYSEELKQLVYSMIQLDPNKRLSIPQILELCELHTNLEPKAKIDGYLLMSDIHEKLQLLDYENTFCLQYNRKPISRIFFANEEQSEGKLEYFYDLAYWLMRQAQERSTPLGPVIDFHSIEGAPNVVKQVVQDARAFGVKIPDSISYSVLAKGYGEAVCFIINDLLTEELMRRRFDFKQPVVMENGVNVYLKELPPENEAIEEIDAELPSEYVIEHTKLIEESEEEIDEELEIEPEEENYILQTFVNPKDWYEEVERIKHLLVVPVESYEEEWKTRIYGIIDYLREVSEKFSENLLEKFELNVEEWSESIERVERAEKRMNELCSREISELHQILEMKRNLATKLNELRFIVKKEVDEFDRFKEAEVSIMKNMELMTGMMNDRSSVDEAKKALRELRTEIREIDASTAIVRNRRDELESQFSFERGDK